MLNSEKNARKKHRDRNFFQKPKSTQDVIPFEVAYEDGMLLSNGKLFSKTFRLSDINYSSEDRTTQEDLIRSLRAIIKSCTAAEISQFTIMNRHITDQVLEELYYPYHEDGCDDLREELNDIICKQSGRGSGIVQDLYFTSSVEKTSPKDAARHFARIETELAARFGQMGSSFTPLSLAERLRLLHDFYRPGDENYWQFNFEEKQRKGHSVKDSIAPMNMAFDDNYFLMHGKFGRVMAITEYANYIDDRTLSNLSALNIPMVLSVNFLPIPTDEAVTFLNKQLENVEDNAAQNAKRQVKSRGFLGAEPYKITQDRKNVKDLMHDVIERDCALVVATISVCFLAESLEVLDSYTEQICSTARECNCEFQPCTYQQLDALNTVLPYGLDRIYMDRSLTSESLAAFMPFHAQEMCDPHGVFYGQHAETKNLVVVDRLAKQSSNGFVLGMTGGGKSFFCKDEIISLRMRYPEDKADFLILDPEKEYTRLVEALGGEVYHIGRDSINLFDLEIDPSEKNPLSYKTEFIIMCMERIVGGELDAQSKSIIDRAVRKIYKPYLNVKASGDAGSPSMQDFKTALDEMRDPRAAEISLALERFTEGYLSVFAQPTNIYTKSSMICYSLTGLQDNVKSLGMLITLDHILNRVMSNFRKGRMTFVYADEFAFLFRDEATGEFFNNLWRRTRKYAGICTGATQNVEEILRSEAGRAMLANSNFVVMLNQAPTNAAYLADLYKISPTQETYFTNVAPGHGLLKVGGALIPFVSEIPKDTELYKLCATDPNRGKEALEWSA